MDIEQLKLVLETVSSLGQETASFAKLWLWLKFFGQLLPALFYTAAAVAVVVLLLKFWYRFEHASGDAFLREMRDALGTGTPGNLADHERHRTTALLRELAFEHLKQKPTHPSNHTTFL